jgi:hypothetical protein
MTPSTVTDFQLALEAAHVLRGQGVDPTRARPELVAEAQAVIDEAQSLIAPAAMHVTLPVRDFQHQRVTLEGGAAFEGALVARALAGATDVALVVCTIGPALDERVSALFGTGDPMRAIALEGAGNAAVGWLSQILTERMCDAALACGTRTGMRASPGQEGWPIEQQRVLFDLLPAGEIGVRLTDSCLMLPRKSVSFAVGFGPGMRTDAVACDFCSRRDRCQWRRRGDVE